ncbi:hypothetical protein AURDEDRAFT_174530 [Auricularia subglabra TFB-10046 SS5]|uniref:Uncharacterized protein n=1 Tax=Auricularia subglabra (strain TFB-10046 / SS5) TaxID=717982 RepID=J0CYM3_AURST|nr:hypothetical protein AURDEDRAFT_174530 [Auricularia subglabra TFB-10046 SS5]
MTTAFLIWKIGYEKRIGHADEPNWRITREEAESRWGHAIESRKRQDLFERIQDDDDLVIMPRALSSSLHRAERRRRSHRRPTISTRQISRPVVHHPFRRRSAFVSRTEAASALRHVLR